MTVRTPLLVAGAALATLVGIAGQGSLLLGVLDVADPITGTLSGSTIAFQSRSATTGVVLVETLLDEGEGAGTGMVIDSSGLVLTNYHVVQGSTQVQVSVPGTGQSYRATVVGHDASRDVALLQLEAAPALATVRIDADGTSIGQSVTAIGNGRGTGVLQTETGVITGSEQSITVQDEASAAGQEHLTGLLETDAQIVPGYSGGPLFDSQGEVVGMNTAGSTTGRVVDAYAVPIGDALAVVDVIRAGASEGTTRVGPGAALGISVSSTQAATRNRLAGAAHAGAGVVVVDVLAGSAAETAGMTPGSTITDVDDTAVRTTAELSQALASHAPGDSVAVSWTDASGATQRATVVLQASTVN